ncbi:hypothetical protein EV421DRAFT_525672 [Armillaria borealis]|uniref:Uncharacterized protein n=1 Tax=Armillaria borealis TaxID=47425 RepID=A0AA39JLK3_9AGAR|nr:hypothetical protein EV421DRAFT_525672 [Armillaria borealis]
MAGIQIYLKPRPISRRLGHSNYLPFKWPFEFKYTPFCANYGPIPSGATEVHTVRSSPDLPASLSKLYNDILPSLDAEVPDPNKFHRSAWPGLLQLAVAKANSSFHFQLECEDHIVQLVKGDRAPTPPPASERAKEFSPEWYDIVHSTLLRGDVELRDESRDTELELFVWAYMFHVADDRGTIWRSFRQEMYHLTKFFFAASLPSSYAESSGLINFVSSKASSAASAIASTFTAATSVEESEPPLLSSSSSNELTSSHAADSDDDTALNRRRNLAFTDSVDV